MKNCLIPFFGIALLLMACGDEVTNISEYGGADTVKAFKDLGKCDKSAIGKFVYVSDSVKVYACTDDGWTAVTGTDGSNGSNGTNGKNGKDGADGKDGTDGKSCTMTAFKDGTGFDVICDGKSIGSVKNGADGADGKDGSNGKDGTSCSVAKAEDSDDAVVTCGDKSVTIHNGVDGKQGEPGTPGTKGADGTNGSNGADGVSCKIASDENGIVQIQCGEGKDATSTKLYKAFCGSKPFDPEKSFCMADGSVYPLCNGKTYVPDTDECVDGVVVQFIKSCGDELYNVHEKFCVNDKTYDLCDGESYDIELEECVEGKKTVVYEKCGDEKLKIADADHLFCAEFENKTTEEKTYQVYKYTTIEVKDKDYSETWMAENVNYKTDDSYCYNGFDKNCKTYGRLYAWDDAQNVCPNGWHMPSSDEWHILFDAVGSISADNISGKVLKSVEGWKYDKPTTTGSDKYGFTALPGGLQVYDGGMSMFDGIDTDAVFWTSSGSGSDGTGPNAVYVRISYDKVTANIGAFSKKSRASVRCIKNAESN